MEITADGTLYVDGKTTDIRSIRSRMSRFAVESPGGGVVIVADQASRTGLMIQALDQCRLAGVENISVAARKPE